MIPRLVPEISPCDAFCDGRMEQQEQEQELAILGSRCATTPSQLNFHSAQLKLQEKLDNVLLAAIAFGYI